MENLINRNKVSNANEYSTQKYFISTKLDDCVEMTKLYIVMMSTCVTRVFFNIMTFTGSRLHKEFSKEQYQGKVSFTLIDQNYKKGKISHKEFKEHIEYLDKNRQYGIYDNLLDIFSLSDTGSIVGKRLGSRLQNFISTMNYEGDMSLYFIDKKELRRMVTDPKDWKKIWTYGTNVLSNDPNKVTSYDIVNLVNDLTMDFFGSGFYMHNEEYYYRPFDNADDPEYCGRETTLIDFSKELNKRFAEIAFEEIEVINEEIEVKVEDVISEIEDNVAFNRIDTYMRDVIRASEKDKSDPRYIMLLIYDLVSKRHPKDVPDKYLDLLRRCQKIWRVSMELVRLCKKYSLDTISMNYIIMTLWMKRLKSQGHYDHIDFTHLPNLLINVFRKPYKLGLKVEMGTYQCNNIFKVQNPDTDTYDSLFDPRLNTY